MDKKGVSDMTYTIETEALSVSILARGAELCSVKTAEKEYLWQGDADFWQGQSPLLFPVIGALKDEKIMVNGQMSHFGNHGFLQHLTFDCVMQQKDCVVLKATCNEETMAEYPYAFSVLATYRVTGRTLTAKYDIINEDAKDMPYFFGLHNGFYCLEEGEQIADVYVDFDQPITIEHPRRSDDNSIDFAHPIRYITQEKTLQFDDAWYPKNAPIMEDISFTEVRLMHRKRGKQLTYSFSENFDTLNLWRQPNSPFICMEPWTGICCMYQDYASMEEMPKVKYIAAGAQECYTFAVEV